MTGDDGPISVSIKANIPLVVRRVSEKDTKSGSRRKLIGDCGGKVGVALTPKDAQVVI